MLPVTDMALARTFYRDVLGLTERFASPEWTELTWRDATIALHRGGGSGERESWLGFHVEDLEGALAGIEAAGGQRGRERIESGSRLVAVADTEGNWPTFGAER